MIYIAVAAVLTGMLPWNQLGTAEPLATAFSSLGMNWPALVISLGAVFATTSVLLVFQFGQPRIFFSMGARRPLPGLGREGPSEVPHAAHHTWMTGIFVAVLAGLARLDEIVQLTNIGTLFAFVLVCIGSPCCGSGTGVAAIPSGSGGALLVPMPGRACCIFLMVYLPPASWWRFVGWLVVAPRLRRLRLQQLRARPPAGRPAGRPPFMAWMADRLPLAGVGPVHHPDDAGLGPPGRGGATTAPPTTTRAR